MWKKIGARALPVARCCGGECLFLRGSEEKKVERPFYFIENRRKIKDFREKAQFSVEKKSLLFGRRFRILGSIGGEKWGFEAVKWRLAPFYPKKGGRGADLWRGCWENRITASTPRAAL